MTKVTMIISHNEIVVACLKAFEALGFPQGQREDAAEAIGWLALHGLPFEDRLTDRLGGLRPDVTALQPLTETATTLTWDAEGRSALGIFSNLVDYGLVKAKTAEEYRLTIHNCPDLELMWPYLATIEKEPFVVECRWSVAADEEWLVRLGQNDGRIFHLTKQSALQPNEIELVFEQGMADISQSLADKSVWTKSQKEWLQEKQVRIQTGIPIDLDLWQTLVTLGKGILVEATEESERRGAGGV